MELGFLSFPAGNCGWAGVQPLRLGCSSFLVPSLPSLLPASHSGQHKLLLLQVLPLYQETWHQTWHQTWHHTGCGCDLRVVAVPFSVSLQFGAALSTQPALPGHFSTCQALPREGKNIHPINMMGLARFKLLLDC